MKNHSFRPLNDNEIHMVVSVEHNNPDDMQGEHGPFYEVDEEDAKRMLVSYERFGKFIVCVIIEQAPKWASGFQMWRGVSHCALDDRFNSARGEAIAFRRAVQESEPVLFKNKAEQPDNQNEDKKQLRFDHFQCPACDYNLSQLENPSNRRFICPNAFEKGFHIPLDFTGTYGFP